MNKQKNVLIVREKPRKKINQITFRGVTKRDNGLMGWMSHRFSFRYPINYLINCCFTFSPYFAVSPHPLPFPLSFHFFLNFKIFYFLELIASFYAGKEMALQKAKSGTIYLISCIHFLLKIRHLLKLKLPIISFSF